MSRGILTFLLVALGLAAQEARPAGDPAAGTAQKEAALGNDLAKKFRGETTLVTNPVVLDYVEKVGRRLTASGRSQKYDYTFEVFIDSLNTNTLDPVAFPGGHIFLPTSIILNAGSETELAGMLAHAMAHIEERHGWGSSEERGVKMGVPAVYLAGGPRTGHAVAPLPLGMLDSEKRFELDADALAVRMMADAGYDPYALAAYISRVQGDGGDLSLSAIPPRDVRIANIQRTIESMAPRSYAPTDQEFARIKTELRLAQ